MYKLEGNIQKSTPGRKLNNDRGSNLSGVGSSNICSGDSSCVRVCPPRMCGLYLKSFTCCARENKMKEELRKRGRVLLNLEREDRIMNCVWFDENFKGKKMMMEMQDL